MRRMRLSTLRTRMNKKRFIIFLTAAVFLFGALIKVYYINYTQTWERQHDVISFGADEGHAAYIEYILNEKKLPDFDPRQKWAFFQPPLHHIISAAVIFVSQRIGLSLQTAQENTQVMTLIYMLFTAFFAACFYLYASGYRKTDRIGVKGIFTDGFLCMGAIVSFHPLFILLSGSINNDALALVLSLLSLFLAARWYEKRSFLNTVLLALSIGLSMLAKLTGGLVSVPIAILMLKVFLGYDGTLLGGKNTKITFADRIKYFFSKYFVKAVVFAAVVFPVGLSFSLYNKIKWDMPINYIPPVGENFPESITLSQRLFSIKTDSIYTYLTTRGDAYDEYSIPLSIVKTSIFGEYDFSSVSRWMRPVGIILFASTVCLILTGIIATGHVMLSKKKIISAKWKIILFGTYITYFLSYIYFALSHRNFSAQDFRYAAICIVCEAIFIGLYVDNINNKYVKYAIEVLSLVFAACSFAAYFIIGYKS